MIFTMKVDTFDGVVKGTDHQWVFTILINIEKKKKKRDLTLFKFPHKQCIHLYCNVRTT